MGATYIVYDSTAGTSSARPVTSWGEVPVTVDIAAHATEPGEVARSFDTRSFTVDNTYTFNETNQTVASTPIAAGVVDEETARRDIKQRLADSLWAVQVDAPLNDVNPWLTYRAALRAVPLQSGFPSSINWPVKPGDQEF